MSNSYLPLTSTLLTTVSLCGCSCGLYSYLLQAADLEELVNCTFQFSPNSQTAILTWQEKNTLSISELARRWNVDRKTAINIRNHHLTQVEGSPQVMRAENGIAIMDIALGKQFNTYLTETLELDVRRRETFARVWFYLYFQVCHYPEHRITKSVASMANDLRMRRKTFQEVLNALIAGEWIIRYGTWSAEENFSHGYSYTLPADILAKMNDESPNPWY